MVAFCIVILHPAMLLQSDTSECRLMLAVGPPVLYRPHVRLVIHMCTRYANHVLDRLSKLVARLCRWEESPCRPRRDPAAVPIPLRTTSGSSASNASATAA